jgi:hypothetical protein
VHDNVIVSHRGARFEVGRGAGFYAIWPARAADGRPIEWWPETPDGWQAAWARFTDVEPRRAIHPVIQPAVDPASSQTGATHLPATLRRAGRPATLAAALLAAGISSARASSSHFGSTSLAGTRTCSCPPIYLVTWAAGLPHRRGGIRQRTGALLAASRAW